MNKWTREEHVNDWLKNKFANLNLKNQKDYFTESAIPDYLKEALRGRSKTADKTGIGTPDFSLTKYKIPILIESKLNNTKHIAQSADGIKFDEASIQNFAVNGAIYYAQGAIASGKYREAFAIGISGDDENAVKISVYYIFGGSGNAYKKIEGCDTLDFLENKTTFDKFYKDAILTEEDKHKILIDSREKLQKSAKELNKLMHNLNITAPERVLYVSGMLLAMQDIEEQDGLKPEDLKGIQTNTRRDGILICESISEFLKSKNLPEDKVKLMLASFSKISISLLRDKNTVPDKLVAKFVMGDSSINKQIFTFIYENIFLSIDSMSGHIDIMGELYSEFLKYALGDGAGLGIVLTPPYITKMMAEILRVNKDNKVMDLATGSAGFLISAMEIMIKECEKTWGKDTTQTNKKIEEIKKRQLLGVELNAEMFTLAATNMILRGDGSSNIQQADTFATPPELYKNFAADKLLLNPPFTYTENGMPFIAFGLDFMQKKGLGAIIIQDSAGSGKAVKSTQKILKNHRLVASIKMPVDLFVPIAGVQTSIYIVESGVPHDYGKTVRFIDFRNDGYKRAKRGISEIDNPKARYQDIIKIYKNGKSAKVSATWDLDKVVVDDY
ncbi:MAG: SAM-dependent methyltransferase, partial [Elusimicrobiota bacterium]|nr:SAM-dependent methyltransferase [Elusimicrobiota bacterium]